MHKTKLLALLLVAAAPFAAFAQDSIPTAGAAIMPFVNSAVTGQISKLPPASGSGLVGIFIDNNATNPGTAYPDTAIMGVGFIYNSGTEVLDVVSPDWNVSTPGAAGYIANKPAVIAPSFNNSPGRSTIVTVAAAANGFQVSSSRNAIVNYSITISTTVSLSGNASGYVVLEIAATNSSTAGDWTEIGRSPSGQSGTLVVGLSLTQSGGGQIGGVVPSGYFVRLRSVNSSGTPTYTYNSGQEVLL